ncbi:hypothetical protein ACTS9D_07480 [Empedobacter brevis]
MLRGLINLKMYYLILFFLMLASCYTPKEKIEGDKYPEIKSFDQVFEKQKILNLNSDKLEMFYQIGDYNFINYQIANERYKLSILKNGEEIMRLDYSTPFLATDIVDNKLIGFANEKVISMDLNNLKNQNNFSIIKSRENDSLFNDSIAKKIKTIYYTDTIVSHTNADLMKGDRMQWYFLVKDSLSNKFYIERNMFRDSIYFNPNNFEWIKQTSENIYGNYASYENNNFTPYDKAVVDNKWCSSGNHFVGSFGYCPVFIKYYTTSFNKINYKFKNDERDETPLQFMNFDDGLYILYDKNLYFFPTQK